MELILPTLPKNHEWFERDGQRVLVWCECLAPPVDRAIVERWSGNDWLLRIDPQWWIVVDRQKEAEELAHLWAIAPWAWFGPAAALAKATLKEPIPQANGPISDLPGIDDLGNGLYGVEDLFEVGPYVMGAAARRAGLGWSPSQDTEALAERWDDEGERVIDYVCVWDHYSTLDFATRPEAEIESELVSLLIERT